jgi:inosose dehydratase
MANEFRVGIQPLTWGDNPFDDTCRQIAATGYDGVEPPVDRYLRDLGPLKEILSRHGLACCATYTGPNLLDDARRDEEMDQELQIAAAVRELGGEVIVLSAPGRRVPRNTNHDAALIKEYAQRINDACRAIRDEAGLVSVFHNHIETLVERAEEIDLFMEHTDPNLLFAGFDTAQLSAAGADPVEYMARYAPRTRYVHLKDRQIGRPTYGNFCELGLGFIDIKTIVDLLRDAGYRGWLTVEVDQSLTTPIGSATVCREYLSKHCGI